MGHLHCMKLSMSTERLSNTCSRWHRRLAPGRGCLLPACSVASLVYLWDVDDGLAHVSGDNGKRTSQAKALAPQS